MFILHDVPWGKPNYRRQFGKAICHKAMVGVVVEVVREGVGYFGKSNFFVFCLFFMRVLFGFLEERRQALPNPMQRFVLGVSVSYELSRAVSDSDSDEYLLRYFCPFVSML